LKVAAGIVLWDAYLRIWSFKGGKKTDIRTEIEHGPRGPMSGTDPVKVARDYTPSHGLFLIIWGEI